MIVGLDEFLLAAAKLESVLRGKEWQFLLHRWRGGSTLGNPAIHPGY